LLNGLGIPFATLLDLDLGRNGGGWGRMKTALSHLIEIGNPRKELLEVEGGGQADLDNMHTWKTTKSLTSWISFLESYKVFYSEPLDIDMTMLKAFPKAYEAIIPKGGRPSGKKETAEAAVLGEGGEGIEAYKELHPGYDELMMTYRYHFLTHSKPATHLRAFAHLDNAALKKGMPKPFRTLLKHITDNLKRD